MERHELREAHFITHKSNVSSIVRHGILSHDRAAALNPVSLADPEIQDRRAGIVVPGARPLHQYANLYMNGRNAMLYRLLRNNPLQDVVVLGIDLQAQADDDLLSIHDVVLTDRNAAARPNWLASPDGLANIDRARLFAHDWNLPDPAAKHALRQAMQAEILVPDLVEPSFIRAIYSCSRETAAELARLGLVVSRNIDLFFGFER